MKYKEDIFKAHHARLINWCILFVIVTFICMGVFLCTNNKWHLAGSLIPLGIAMALYFKADKDDKLMGEGKWRSKK